MGPPARPPRRYLSFAPGSRSPSTVASVSFSLGPRREEHPVRDEALAEVARREVRDDDDALAHELLRA